MLLALCLLSALVAAVAASTPIFLPSTTGFDDGTIHSSIGGRAICVVGTVPVTASATNFQFDFEVPQNQSGVNRKLLDIFTAGSTFAEDAIVGTQTVNGTWNIGAQLCFPPTANNGSSARAVHILTHGVGFDKSYWDFAPGYSYVDTAVQHGYATLAFDRLGWGASDTPAALDNQAPLQIEILHQLTLALRSGRLADVSFDKVVGVAHSFGSIQTLAINAEYPNDCDATILTGYAVSSEATSAQPVFFSSLDWVIANQESPYRFANYPDGYQIPSTASGIEYAFLYPYSYDPSLVAQSYATTAGFTWGEYLSGFVPGGNATKYVNPVAVVDGVQDLPNCLLNCSYPQDGAALVREARYPGVDSSKFDSLLIDGVGHGLNLHYQAEEAFEWIMDFLRRQKL